MTPTSAQFKAFEAIFAHFNRTLFSDGLPPVMLNFSRKLKTRGFFAPNRWEEGQTVHHEISLNPSILKARTPKETASTIVHEMCHLWQEVYGKPSRSGYHNKEWAEKMKAVGLQPSDTGEEGGNEVGQSVAHYIIAGGAFERSFEKLGEKAWLPLTCYEPPKPPKPPKDKNKSKYECPCGQKVWGKPEMSILCGECEGEFEEQV